MNERIEQLARQVDAGYIPRYDMWQMDSETVQKFAELIVREVCGMMEQAEDDAYHCFEPSERPTEYIEWLRDWQERFTKHFGVEE
jgi:hypothetical protein